ncbi:MAG: HPr family phosphocarrier protein [Verrucomicrobiales bacterium]|nr:HPr family phosphocarrier protein [Verrucomicrobiae bacterium]MCP5553654.1 HPr family phosphocarrier protein [Akkermansiaceae bacterium]
MVEKDFTIVNKEGLHARPAAMFVKISNRFRSEIWVSKDDENANGKSIMAIMLLAAEHGSVIHISAEGDDEKEALDSLGALVDSGFRMDP